MTGPFKFSSWSRCSEASAAGGEGAERRGRVEAAGGSGIGAEEQPLRGDFLKAAETAPEELYARLTVALAIVGRLGQKAKRPCFSRGPRYSGGVPAIRDPHVTRGPRLGTARRVPPPACGPSHRDPCHSYWSPNERRTSSN